MDPVARQVSLPVFDDICESWLTRLLFGVDLATMNTREKMSLAFIVTKDEEVRSSSVNSEGDNIATSEVSMASGCLEITPKPVVSKGFECEECLTTCKFKGEKLYHMYVHGEEPTLIPCLECNMAFRKMFSYRNHMKCVHQKVRPHKCEECEKSFFFRKDLSKHILAVHERRKPFSCPHCQRCFAKKEHMHRHVRALHASEKQRTDFATVENEGTQLISCSTKRPEQGKLLP